MKRSQKSIKTSCDKLWSRLVRAGGVCEKCGKTSREVQLHPHHVYGRGNYRLRFDLRNGCCLCARCHMGWAESYPIAFADWFRQQRPEDAAYLEGEFRKGPINRTLKDYERLEMQLTEMLERVAA